MDQFNDYRKEDFAFSNLETDTTLEIQLSDKNNTNFHHSSNL